jgi:hypothetical protein
MLYRVMTYIEFGKLISESGIPEESIGPRENNICFNLSMMTHVDELQSDKHQKMLFIEFIEAFCKSSLS